MIIAEIIPLNSSIFTESLSYFSVKKINPGSLVSIPFRKKEILGIVISTSEVKNIKQNLRQQNFTIRSIKEIYNSSIFSPAYLMTVEVLKDYYLINSGKLINITSPRYVQKNFKDFIKKNISTKKINRKKKTKKYILQKSYEERILFYKNLIEEKKQKKESLQIICPTIRGVKNLEKILKKYFPKETYTLSGKTSTKKLKEAYEEIRKKPSVLISTPQFIDTDILGKNMLILENDSSYHYKQVKEPHVDMRIFIEEYAKNAMLDIIFADGVLRKERFKKKYDTSFYAENLVDSKIFTSKKIKILSLLEKRKRKQSDIERINEINEKKQFSPFSKEMLKYLKKSIENKEKIFIYTRRKGLAPNIFCRNCGKLVQNLETKNPYCLYVEKNEKKNEKKFFYIDRIEKKIIPAFDTCQFCGSWKLETMGIGTEKIREELESLFPKIQISLIDGKNTKKESEIKNNIKEFYSEDEKAHILIGTQKALPYLSLVDSSFLVSIDGIFYQSFFDVEMKALYIIKNIYDKTKKTTYIQTRHFYEEDKKIEITTKKEKVPKENKKINNLGNIKFSKKILSRVDTLSLPKSLARIMKSRYTENLKIWEIIKIGNYSVYNINEKINKKTFIQIKHKITKEKAQNLYIFYQKKFEFYRPKIYYKYADKKNIFLIVNLLLQEKDWNTEKQDKKLLSILPRSERNISIEINSELYK